MHQLGDGAECRQRLLDEGRLAPGEKPVECVSEIDRSTLTHDSTGNVGPADCAGSGLVQHILEGKTYPQTLQPLDHGFSPAHPVSAAPLEKCVQLGRMFRQVVAEDMHLAPRSGGRELTSGDYTNPEPLTRGDGFGNTTYGIVISEGNRRETGGMCTLHHRFRRQTAIRGRRVNVEVDGCGVSHVFGRIAQRRYPISGAVQDGWE